MRPGYHLHSFSPLRPEGVLGTRPRRQISARRKLHDGRAFACRTIPGLPITGAFHLNITQWLFGPLSFTRSHGIKPSPGGAV